MSKQRKRIVPNVVRGGTAIPIGDNFFYMQGRKHEQGGIDIGNNAETGLEVEGGEVVETSPNSIRVFSSVPFLYGESPANLVRSGVNPDDVFNAQERFKDINKINDDGTMKKYKNGGNRRLNLYSMMRNKGIPAGYVIDFRGGDFGGAGASSTFNNNQFTNKLYDYIRNTPIAIRESFTDAYRNAVNSGLSEFEWNGRKIKVENSDNPNYTRKEYRTDIIGNIREILDENMNAIPDSTKIEPYVGQIPGTIRREYRNGGLSRSKNYGSSKKPYPSVKSEDFAGENRSYPIPTKADAIDALRLAGLHGRSDVKSKVYKKYPELRKKALLGIYSSISSERKPMPEIKVFANTNSGKKGIDVPKVEPIKLNHIDTLYQERYGLPINEIYLDSIPENSPYIARELIDSLPNITPYKQLDYKIKREIPSYDIRDFYAKNPYYTMTGTKPGIDTALKRIYDYNLEIPVINNDILTKLAIQTLPETITTPVEKKVNNTNGNQTPITSQAIVTVPTKREIDDTFGEWGRTLQRNVPLLQGRAISEQGINLDDRVNQYINDRIVNNREQVNSKNNIDYINLILDGIGGLTNIGGNIASNIINRQMLNDLEYSSAPIPLFPTKLKTRININPQLQRLYRDLGIMEDVVNSNTTSSRTALARNQRLRNQARQVANELYGNKENIETQLINRDRLNQQQVAASNLARYDKWRAGKTEFDNKVREMLSENDVALTQGVAGAISDILSSIATRNQEAKNLAYLSMSNPYAVEALNSTDFKNLYRMYGGFRCGGKKKVNRK